MTTIPKFLLTKHITVTCHRSTAGQYVNGEWHDGVTTPFQIEANVQPLRYHEQMLLKEADRSKDWINVYTASTLIGLEQGTTGTKGDIIDWQGSQWQVMRVQHWQMGVLNHSKAQAARLETTLQTSYPVSP